MRYLWEPYTIYSNKKALAKGDVLFSQGRESSGFYYLAEGRLNIQLLSKDGKERIVDYLADGFLLGEQGVLGQPYSSTAVCDTDTIVYYFSTETFKKICKEHPEANKIFMNSLISKIRLLVDTIGMINKPYEQQMAHYFLQLYQKNNKNPFSISQISLAKYIGTSRVTVYKIMQKWLVEGIISRRGHKIHILDPNKLKTLYGCYKAEIAL
ncbi:hypothetical protein BIV60_19840 [Bacillus sp. MUM 116]|uniref:Crp/Fnr family transcriptional regulator n=1 Tax=Bacillus sp. MUM 116 TaxID=1678002 RepID=UPI0008F5B456|nr:Crp/Fnr family transcriptional regulator [Bacillus sp. MUM 116]OIK10726.1 hypothetical protein BIV60_19840 [Bacillus sp. MUM 116]